MNTQEEVIKDLEQRLASVKSELEEIHAKLGCHRAFIIQEIESLQSQAENTPTADQYHQLQSDNKRLRDVVEASKTGLQEHLKRFDHALESKNIIKELIASLERG